MRTTHKHGVEPSLTAGEREKVRGRFTRSKVRLLSLGTTCEFHSADAKVRREHVEEAGRFIDLAHDLGCWGIKVRPNGFPEGVPERVTLQRIGESLRECGELGERKGVEIWVEVHGRGTRMPANIRTMMEACGHPWVGVCWNSNATDVVNGSVKDSFELLRPYIKNCHITELVSGYPYREFFPPAQEVGLRPLHAVRGRPGKQGARPLPAILPGAVERTPARLNSNHPRIFDRLLAWQTKDKHFCLSSRRRRFAPVTTIPVAHPARTEV